MIWVFSSSVSFPLFCLFESVLLYGVLLYGFVVDNTALLG